jgi:hypothetical protein
MASVRKEIFVDVPADDVWDAVRDFGALDRRLVAGFVTATTLDGDVRTITYANGMVMRELMVDRDDERRRLVYIPDGDSPFDITHYNGSVQVFSNPGEPTRIEWIVDILPHSMADTLESAMTDASVAMKRTLES